MLARILSATPWGADARTVEIEVDVHDGLPNMTIVGLADAAVRESRERVRAAIKNCGFRLRQRAVTVNLAPADLKKEGNHLDLAIALGTLGAYAQLPEGSLAGRLVCGELGLDGTVRPVRGLLAIADRASRSRIRELIVPVENRDEAAALGKLDVVPVSHLGEAIEHIGGVSVLSPYVPDRREVGVSHSPPTGSSSAPDLADVRGQETAKRALEIAAAGGHNLLLIGPPGCGKTMLARRLPGILPPLSRSEAIEVTKLHSIVAPEPPRGLLRERPFRAPHPGTSTAGLIGGGTIPRPGEASLAHHGVLFLDELPELRRDTLEALRQPLEDGEIHIARARAQFSFPARFSLICACNPCPCGYLGDSRVSCRCSERAIERYRAKLSGPLLDRIDLHVEVPSIRLDELAGPSGERSEEVAERVSNARRRQAARMERTSAGGRTTNASMTSPELRLHAVPDTAGQALLDRAFEALGLSVRAVDRILKVARTIADLDRSEGIVAKHLAEAIQFRTLDRR